MAPPHSLLEVARRRRVDVVFAFDNHFWEQGFKMKPLTVYPDGQRNRPTHECLKCDKRQWWMPTFDGKGFGYWVQF